MKTRTILQATRLAAGLAVLGAMYTLNASPDGMRVRFTGTEYPTGEVFDPGNTIGLLPDADGIIRPRGVVVGGIQTLKIPKLGTPDLVLHIKADSNFDLDTTTGFNGITWCSWTGYVTDAGGSEVLVAQGFAYGFRQKISDAKWLEKAVTVGVFCSGPLDGVVMNATVLVESWDPMMATGYAGKIRGELIVPDSVPLRPHGR